MRLFFVAVLLFTCVHANPTEQTGTMREAYPNQTSSDTKCMPEDVLKTACTLLKKDCKNQAGDKKCTKALDKCTKECKDYQKEKRPNQESLEDCMKRCTAPFNECVETLPLKGECKELYEQCKKDATSKPIGCNLNMIKQARNYKFATCLRKVIPGAAALFAVEAGVGAATLGMVHLLVARRRQYRVELLSEKVYNHERTVCYREADNLVLCKCVEVAGVNDKPTKYEVAVEQ